LILSFSKIPVRNDIKDIYFIDWVKRRISLIRERKNGRKTEDKDPPAGGDAIPRQPERKKVGSSNWQTELLLP